MKTLAALLVACACSLAFAGPASAAVLTVDDLTDAHDSDFPAGPFDGICDAAGADTCTLRAALEESVGTNTINVTVPGPINLTEGAFVVSAGTTINGHAGVTTIDANGAGRVLIATSGSTVTLSDLRLQNGATVDDGGAGILSLVGTLTLNRVTVTGNTLNSASGGIAGGGIRSTANSTLVLNDSTISGNTVIGTSGQGGGIRSEGPLTLNRSTISGNSSTLDAGGRAGGIDLAPGGSVAFSVTNSTISGNQSGGTPAAGGGGVFANGNVTTTIVGSTIAGNTTAGNGGGLATFGLVALSENTIYAGNTDASGSNCILGGGVTTAENNIDTGTSCGFGTTNGNQENVSSGALGLGALALNGGPTQTRSIAAGSVAQNAASADCGGLAVDQRNVTRPQSASCDIGAFELVVTPPPPPSGGGGTPITPITPIAPAVPKKCKKGQKLKKGKCVKKRRKKK